MVDLTCKKKEMAEDGVGERKEDGEILAPRASTKISLCQVASLPLDIAANLRSIEKHLQDVAAMSDLVVFPEVCRNINMFIKLIWDIPFVKKPRGCVVSSFS